MNRKSRLPIAIILLVLAALAATYLLSRFFPSPTSPVTSTPTLLVPSSPTPLAVSSHTLPPPRNPQGPRQAFPDWLHRGLRSPAGDTARWGLSARGSKSPHETTILGGVRRVYSPDASAQTSGNNLNLRVCRVDLLNV
jgi:hypothetical protein